MAEDTANFSRIVCGGGWKENRTGKVKVKAWLALLATLGLGGAALWAAEPLFLAMLGGASTVSLVVSIALFVREKPRQFETFCGPVGHDPRKLYGATGPALPANRSHTDSPSFSAGAN